MPVQSVNFDIGVLAAAGQEAADDYRDGLAINCSLLHWQEKANGKGTKKWKGGQYYPGSINMQNHTGISQFVDGFELFDASANETQRVPLYPLCVSGLLMKIGVTERYIYGATDGAMQTKVRTLTQSCMGFLQRSWEQRILTATGSGFGNWLTLNGIDSSAGVFERGAAGSGQSNTIGGLSKATYASVIGWNNRVANLNNAFGTNQIGLYSLVQQTRIHKPETGKKAWFMTLNGMVNIKRVVQGYQRFTSTDSKSMDFGTPVEFYQGIPIYQDTFLPVAGAATTTYPMTALLLDADDIFWAWGKAQKGDGAPLPDGYFGTGQWAPIGGLQSVIGCPMMVVGNTIVLDMGSSGIAYAGETY